MVEFAEVQNRLARIFQTQTVFVVGATRWGTAWVQQCLDAHPEVCCKGEGHFTDVLFPMVAKVMDEYNTECDKIGNRMQVAGLPGNAAGFTFDDVDFLLKTAVGLVFNRWVGEDTGIKCIGEKTPEHVLSLELLDRVLPDVKVIHVYRDGRDEAVSAWEFNIGLSRGEFPDRYPNFSGYAEVFARNWSRSVAIAKKHGRAHRVRFHDVRCEELVNAPIPLISRMCKFLGVDDDPAVARDCSDAAWDASPLDVEPGIWKSAFDDEAVRAFNRQCGELLKLLDYED